MCKIAPDAIPEYVFSKFFQEACPQTSHTVKKKVVNTMANSECQWKFLVTVIKMASDVHYLPTVFTTYFLLCMLMHTVSDACCS